MCKLGFDIYWRAKYPQKEEHVMIYFIQYKSTSYSGKNEQTKNPKLPNFMFWLPREQNL